MKHFIRKFIGNHPKTFFRFCIVGGINTVIDYSLFLLFFYAFNFHLLAANALGFFVATGNSYVLNKFWTFGDGHNKVNLRQFLTFLAVTTSALILSSVAIYLCAKIVPEYIAKLMAIGVTVMWNYTGSRFFVFKPKT